MFDKILIKLGLKYDFSQWDRGKFPLGAPSVTDELLTNVPEELFVSNGHALREIVISPQTAKLLSFNGEPPVQWQHPISIDENIIPSQPVLREANIKRREERRLAERAE